MPTARWSRYVTGFRRLALGTAFLSVIAGRLDVWGRPGQPGVTWGDFCPFPSVCCAHECLPAAPAVPLVSWIATIWEAVLGVARIVCAHRCRNL
jgi:hypothetical protein